MIFTDFIVCDDIRLEASGQNTLIGVYNDSIIFNVSPSEKDIWPKFSSISIFSRLMLGEEDNKKNISKLELFVTLNDIEISVGKISFDKSKIKKSKRIAIVSTLKNFKFDNAGNLSVILKGYNEKDKIVAEVKATTSIKIEEVVIDQQNMPTS